jgi:adenylate cyclase
VSKNKKSKNTDNIIRFSIGAKLVTIITILVLVSLGTITLLVSYLVREDLQVTAEENNFEVNRRTASEAEYTLSNVHANCIVLMRIIFAAGIDSDLAKLAADSFFERNPQIAALQLPVPGRNNMLVNQKFFTDNEIDDSLVYSFYEMNGAALERASRGEQVFLNAAPHFSAHILALFFPVQGTISEVSILFSPENLNASFSSSVNQSYLINSNGDVLIHPDFELVAVGANIANRGFINSIRESTERNRQYSDDGEQLFIAYTKLNIGASIAITSIEYDKVFEGIAATTRRNLYLTAAVLFLSILFIWFFSKTISVALKQLARAARDIEGGLFEQNLIPKSHDEISYLTESFQRMSKALGVFGRFTNREIAVKAMRGEIKPGGLPKHATIFFSDIRGFTEKSEIFTKEFGEEASDRIVQWLNEYFTSMVECVEKTNGVVDKFIGDAVMAHWGTAYSAGSPAKDAFNCVKAALMMRKSLYYMNQKRMPGDKGNPPIMIGCGINTGIVTAGQLGSDMRMEYTVIGDPVNLASRIESLNKPLGTDILISEDTYDLIQHQFITEEMPSVTVKGKEKPVRLFAVVNHIAVTTGPQTLAEVRELLGIKPPDTSKLDVNAEEKKYKIGSQ